MSERIQGKLLPGKGNIRWCFEPLRLRRAVRQLGAQPAERRLNRDDKGPSLYSSVRVPMPVHDLRWEHLG